MKPVITNACRRGRLIGRAVSSLAAAVLLAAASAFPSAAQDVSFTKAFSPATIGPGSVSTLEFTISVDAGAAAGLQNAAFTDVLPAAVTIASPSAATTSCGDGIIDAPNGGSTITFSNARIGIGTSCTVTVYVTASAAGTHSNVSSDLTADGRSFGVSEADLVVSNDRPGFTKSFFPDTVGLGARSTLTFLIDNSANANPTTTLLFSDALPPGMTIADPANASTTCEHPQVPATLVADPGSDRIDFSFFGFSSLTPPPVCQITVDVVAGAVGPLGNTTTNLAATVSNQEVSSGKAAAVLNVSSSPFAFTKSFTNDPVSAGGFVELVFSITNLDRSDAATAIAFTDDLAAALIGVSNAGGDLTNVCGPGSTLSGTTFLTFANGSLAPGETCTFSVTLQVPASSPGGIYVNTTSTLTASVGGTATVGIAASDNLFVSTAGPVLSKSFVDDPVSPGATVTLRFEVQNANTTSSLTDISFDDELTSFLPFPVSAGLAADGFCGAASAMALNVTGTDTQALQITGASLAAGTSCSFDVTLDIPADMPGGTYLNTTDRITGILGTEPVEGNKASDELVVIGAPTIQKAFDPSVTAPGTEVTLLFTLAHGEEEASAATNIAFTDDLSAMLAGLEATNTPIADACGAGSQLTGTDVLSLSDGSLEPGSSCTIPVTVTVPGDAAYGTHTNTTNNVSATVGGFSVSGNSATADLIVTPLRVSKEFTNDPVGAGGTVVLQFEIVNLSATDAASGIFFTDNLNDVIAGLQSSSGTQNNVCGSGSSLSGTNLLTFVGGALAPGASCTFAATLSIPAEVVSDTYRNVTSAISATVGGAAVTAPPATDVLTIDAAPSLALAKEFTDDPATPGETVTLAFTISYDGPPGSTATGISFSDDLGAMLSGAAAVGLPLSDVCGAGSQIGGTSLLALTGGELADGDSCTFEVTVLLPGAVDGSFTNTTSEVLGRVNGDAPVQGDPASDDLEVAPDDGRSVGIEAGDDLPESFSLSANYPNPFRDVTEITFALPHEAEASVTVFDMLGRPVRVLASDRRPAGWHSVTFDASGLPAGIYVYQLTAGDFVASRAMVLLK